MPKKSNLKQFTEALYKVWGDGITVAPNAVYENSITKIDVICKVHGPFKARPDTLLRGIGCAACRNVKKKTTDEFIAEARKVHGEKYDYSKVEYVNASTKVLIICPEHGGFLQEAHAHLKGSGCPECAQIKRGEGKRPTKLTTEEFVRRAKEVHGDAYDYSETVYNGAMSKITVKRKDGTYEDVFPFAHLKKRSLPDLREEKIKSFIEKATALHNGKYDYSKVHEEFVNMKTQLTVICPKHGEFKITPSMHLQGSGCGQCRIEDATMKNKERFLERMKALHGGKYDYSKVDYKNLHEKICIICPIHGEFWQTPHAHAHGQGCPECGRIKATQNISDTTEDFIRKSRKVHGDRYDYSKVEYVRNAEPVCIICPKHGEFWQTPNGHKDGNGCPHCASSSMENALRLHFINNGIEFEDYKRFDWLGRLSLDFYLPEYNVGIECQGVQHFEPIPFFGGDEGFSLRRKRDTVKKELCLRNGVTLIYYLDVAFNGYLSADELKCNSVDEMMLLLEKIKASG